MIEGNREKVENVIDGQLKALYRFGKYSLTPVVWG